MSDQRRHDLGMRSMEAVSNQELGFDPVKSGYKTWAQDRWNESRGKPTSWAPSSAWAALADMASPVKNAGDVRNQLLDNEQKRYDRMGSGYKPSSAWNALSQQGTIPAQELIDQQLALEPKKIPVPIPGQILISK